MGFLLFLGGKLFFGRYSFIWDRHTARRHSAGKHILHGTYAPLHYTNSTKNILLFLCLNVKSYIIIFQLSLKTNAFPKSPLLKGGAVATAGVCAASPHPDNLNAHRRRRLRKPPSRRLNAVLQWQRSFSRATPFQKGALAKVFMLFYIFLKSYIIFFQAQ